MADTQFTTGSQSRGKSGPIGAGETGVDPERMIESAKNVGNQLVGAVRDQATSLLDEQRSRAADQVASVAGMVRNAVQSLDRESAGAVCGYADDTARAIDDFADRLRTASWGELADDVEDFARRWPMVFMASAIATGFIAGRFLISSGSRRHKASTPTQTPSTNTTAPGVLHEPRGGARYDYGAVGGAVSGTGKAGYGAGGSTETN
jgi:hypothetical protein